MRNKNCYEELEKEKLISIIDNINISKAIGEVESYNCKSTVQQYAYAKHNEEQLTQILLDKIKKDSKFYSIPIIYQEAIFVYAKSKAKKPFYSYDGVDFLSLFNILEELSQIFIISEQIQKEEDNIPKQKWYKSVISKLFKPKFKMQLPKQNSPTFVDMPNREYYTIEKIEKDFLEFNKKYSSKNKSIWK